MYVHIAAPPKARKSNSSHRLPKRGSRRLASPIRHSSLVMTAVTPGSGQSENSTCWPIVRTRTRVSVTGCLLPLRANARPRADMLTSTASAARHRSSPP